MSALMGRHSRRLRAVPGRLIGLSNPLALALSRRATSGSKPQAALVVTHLPPKSMWPICQPLDAKLWERRTEWYVSLHADMSKKLLYLANHKRDVSE
jgi:hypothetical protein